MMTKGAWIMTLCCAAWGAGLVACDKAARDNFVLVASRGDDSACMAMSTKDGEPLDAVLEPMLAERASKIIDDASDLDQWAKYATQYLSLAAAGCSRGMRDLQTDRGISLDEAQLGTLRKVYSQLPEHLAMPPAAAHDDGVFLDWLYRNARPWSELTIREVARFGDASAITHEPGWYWSVFDYARQKSANPPPADSVLVLVSSIIPAGENDPLILDLVVVFDLGETGWTVVRVVPSAAAQGDLSRRLVL